MSARVLEISRRDHAKDIATATPARLKRPSRRAQLYRFPSPLPVAGAEAKDADDTVSHPRSPFRVQLLIELGIGIVVWLVWLLWRSWQ